MGSHLMNNTLQTALVYQMAGRESGSGTPPTSQNGTSLSNLPSMTSQVVSGVEGGLSPAVASLVAQTVQPVLAAKQSAH